MDDIAKQRVDLLVKWIKRYRGDLLAADGEVSPVLLAMATGGKQPSYWSDVLRKSDFKSFAAASARKTEDQLGIPYLYLEGSSWPFEDVDHDRWDRLTERQKGRVEIVINNELDRIEAEKKIANGTSN